MDTKAVLTMKQRGEVYCPHIKTAREAKSDKRYAHISYVNVEALAKKIADDEVHDMLRNHGIEGEIAVHVLPGENLVVPNMYEEDLFVHIR
jgi:hypothetical protein